MAIPQVDPAIVNLDVYAGATFSEMYVWEHDGAAVNLTGTSARLKARDEYPDTTALFDISTSTSGITLTAAGEITLTFTATETAAVGATLGHTQTQLVYDLEIVDGAQVVQLMRGIINLYPEATR